jgi:medium-chain acyl-[acyl-carrier-protein] hydrolase
MNGDLNGDLNGGVNGGDHRWVARPRRLADARLRMFCFPHVGAGAAAFNGWLDRLPDGVELCAIRPPGRENRLREPLLDDWRAFLDALEPAVAPLLDRPFVLVGHCSGSVLAYEFARRLRAAGTARPVLLVLSSTEGPALRHVDEPLHLLPRGELLQRVVGYGGMAPQVLADPELTDMFERILRADYRVVERLRYSDGPPLDVPVAVVGGRHDRFVTPRELVAWSAETTREFTLYLLDAGHYLIEEAGALVADVVRPLVDREVRA